MTDTKTLNRCQVKIAHVLNNLDRNEKRFKAFCNFYAYGPGTEAEQDQLRRTMYELLQPIKDVFVINALLEEKERKQMPAFDKDDLSRRKEEAYRNYGRAITLQQSHERGKR
ncbi:hypothetical protein [Planococcus beigongshangi]|uniref:hypothetical protein n=1 Tax=Planococcus beigongshangi TaxID=2782536 RepID=UPI00193B6EF2|nr:hypothetical protein [Planococcus beigongshangi]